MSTESKAKYRALKRKLRFLIYEQECFQEELRRAQRKLLKISRDKSFLLDRLLQYERVEGSSSDSGSTASSDSEKESKKSSETKKQKKKAKPIKVKAKKRKQRQLKSLLTGDRKPLPGNLNYTASQQHQQQQQQLQLHNNSKLMDLMKVGSPNVQMSASPLVSLGLPMHSQESLFPGIGLPGFNPSQPLTPQHPSKFSSLLSGDSSAMGALMMAGLAAAAAGEKAEKQGKKKHKKDIEKATPYLHPSVYPTPFNPPTSTQTSPAQTMAVGKPMYTSKSSPSPLREMIETKPVGARQTTPTNAKSKAAATGGEEEGEELVIDLPND